MLIRSLHMSDIGLGLLLCLGTVTASGVACESAGNDCGPTEAVVARVIDGDTVELESGERVRYLLVDTPEISEPSDCFGFEARDFNESIVEGKTVQLSYDVECTDHFDRLLAYVEVEGRSVNELLLERGYACVLQIDPNGVDRVDDYRRLEQEAELNMAGLWSICAENPCD